MFRPLSTTPRASTAAAATLDGKLGESPLFASADVTQGLVQGIAKKVTEEEVTIETVIVGDQEIVKRVATKREVQRSARLTAHQLHELACADPKQNDLPETSTSYKMPEALFRAAKNATPGTAESFWSHSLYRSPPDAEGKVKKPTIHYCRTIHTTEKVIKDHFTGKKVIGFDIEWQPEAYKLSKARKNVSLVQIACEDRIALFHIALYPYSGSGHSLTCLVAPSLKKLMEDPEITKVGVAIKGDCTRLKNYLDIHARGIFELSHLHKLVRFSKSKDYGMINRTLVSLAKQVQEHLHLPLFKGDDVRGADWSQKLDMPQILYAASDSYAGFQLYHTLELKRLALDPVPPRPYHAELNEAIRIADGVEIPADRDDPVVTPADAILIQRTRKNGKKVAKLQDSDESVSDEDGDAEYVPASAPPHSFFTSASSDRYSAINQNTDRITRSRDKLKLGDVSHLPLKPSQIDKRSQATYFLWLKHPKKDLEHLGKELRSPPVAPRAVAKMIIEAIKANKLPYEKRRLREVLGIYGMHVGGTYIPQHPYFQLARDCGYNEWMEKQAGDAAAPQ